ncbi:MAG: hypothetical protein KDA72_13665 [Planctomycetales bacterium]|nr:hypothetical protein [Planctomycetales bacterium]
MQRKRDKRWTLQMQRITPTQLEDWRIRRVDYLERITVGRLGAINRILRLMALHAHDLNLLPSQTSYRKWGKNGKGIKLRFSKSGEPKLEAAWSRHYVSPKFKQSKKTTTLRSSRASL